MLGSLLSRLLGPAPEPLAAQDTRLALTALLVRLARTDGFYAFEEVEAIEAILQDRYDLDAFGASELRKKAEEIEQSAPDTVRFTRALKEATPLEEREGLLQALWSVALADGNRDSGEDSQMRMITSLLGLSDVQSALARQKAARARGGASSSQL